MVNDEFAQDWVRVLTRSASLSFENENEGRRVLWGVETGQTWPYVQARLWESSRLSGRGEILIQGALEFDAGDSLQRSPPGADLRFEDIELQLRLGRRLRRGGIEEWKEALSKRLGRSEDWQGWGEPKFAVRAEFNEILVDHIEVSGIAQFQNGADTERQFERLGSYVAHSVVQWRLSIADLILGR